jgi:medium-chain acyl-[acyl-carrier-protein] hydrolase
MHQLPAAEFVDALRSLGGTPEAVLENQQMLRMVLPMLRADFTLTETYIYERDAPLACPISAFGGERDRLVSRDKLNAWRDQTSEQFQLRMFPGGHFFIHNERSALLQAIQRDLLDR